MKKILLIICVMLAVSCTNTAKSFFIDGFWFEITSEEKHEVTVVGIGNKAASEIIVPSVIKYYSTEYSVTSIGFNRYGVFRECTNLTTVTLPESLTMIGQAAFSGCTNLTTINIPESVIEIKDTAFEGCTNLSSITLPKALTSIEHMTFLNCTSLTSIVIPESVKQIKWYAFNGCSNLVSVSLPESLTYIDNAVFSGCTCLSSIVIPKSVAHIGESAFYYCASLTSINIPAPVNDIPKTAFGKCSSLTDISVDDKNKKYCSIDGIVYDKSRTSLIMCPEGKSGEVVIPSSVKRIREGSFTNCSGLTSIFFPESIEQIGDRAFNYCTNLKEILIDENNRYLCSIDGVVYNKSHTKLIICPEGKSGDVVIPESVKIIDEYGFCRCSGLTKVTIPGSVTEIGKYAFCRCSSLTELTIPESITEIGIFTFNRCSGLTKVTIPGSVTEIGREAFSYCSNLTTVTVPESAKSIGEFAFADCSNLYSASIPKSLKVIENGVFYNCPNLTKIDVPKSITKIGDYSFLCCNSLNEIYIPNSVNEIGNQAFYGCTGLISVIYDTEKPIDADANIFGANWIFEDSEIYQNAMLFVPEAAVEKFREIEPWKNFRTIRRYDPAALTLNSESINLVEGDSYALAVAIMPENSTDETIIWSTSDSSIATVDSDGIVTAISEGSATITAECGAVSAICTVIVSKRIVEASALTMNVESLELIEGDSYVLVATVSPDDTTDKTVIWSTSDSSIATVDSDGIITAISEGSATITAACGAVSAECRVVVKPFDSITDVGYKSISIRIIDGCISIQAPVESLTIIYDMTGTLFYSGYDRIISVEKNKVYIVVVNDKVFKVKV